jgi:hypothetical protein
MEEPPISLRVYLETLLAAVKVEMEAADTLLQAHIDSNRQITLAKVLEIETARAIAKQEIDAHLSKLNGEHDTLRSMAETYVRSDIYAVDTENRRKDEAEARKATEENRRRQLEMSAANRRNTIGWVTAILTALIGWGISIMLSRMHQP